jgi:hypothetical protein
MYSISSCRVRICSTDDVFSAVQEQPVPYGSIFNSRHVAMNSKFNATHPERLTEVDDFPVHRHQVNRQACLCLQAGAPDFGLPLLTGLVHLLLKALNLTATDMPSPHLLRPRGCQYWCRAGWSRGVPLSSAQGSPFPQCALC